MKPSRFASQRRIVGGAGSRTVRSLGLALVGGIGVLALAGCAFLPFASLPGLFALQSELQPRGEVVTDPPANDFDVYGEQQPNWTKCGSGMKCADVYAPLDWAEPDGDRITLRLVKQEALSGMRQGTIFVNPGGPGASGADFVMDYIDGAAGRELQDSFDIIGWDPRGVGASSAVSCLPPAGMDEVLFGPSKADQFAEGSDEWIAAAIEENAEFGAACLASTGELLHHVGTASTVQDLDMLREIVGDSQLNYLGYSYGTYIGSRYADRYPDRVGRLVLDGAIDPTATEAEVVREQTLGFEAALRAYVTDCLGRSGCPFSGSVDAGMQRIGQLLDQVDTNPIPAADGRTLYVGTMLTAIITPLYSQSNWTLLDDLFSSVGAGSAETAFWLADFYYSREFSQYLDNSTEAFMAINCVDYPRSFDPDTMRAEAAELARIAPTIGRFQGFGGTGCAEWPAASVTERLPTVAAGAAPILVIGNTGDPATPYHWSQSLVKQLDSGVMVTLQGEGHTSYGTNQCVNDVVENYFLTGAVPASDPMCQ